MANLADLFDSAAARALDAQASALAADGGWGLMAQAGQAAWHCLLQHWPQARRIGVVVGAGNNGGDGQVLARHALQAGREVTVIALPGRPPSTALAQRAASEFRSGGGTITVDSVCTFGGTTTTSHAVVTGSFDSAYTMKVASTRAGGPPMPGGAPGAETHMTIEAKWLGPCAAGQKPGDVIMSNGMSMNVLDLQKMRGAPPRPQ